MIKVIPFKTTANALTELDNGGKFYNLFTKADDGNISVAELGKVAGVFGDRQIMVLYLEMSLSELGQAAIGNIHSALSPELKEAYEQYRPQRLLPSEVASSGKLTSNAIITGIPEFVESNSKFIGYTLFPIYNGTLVTFMMMPLADSYDVYQLRDENSSEEFFIAHGRDSLRLPEQKIRCGGILKELQKDENENANEKPEKFLESIYYSLV